MDESLREELQRAIALDDECRAEFAQHEAKRSHVEKRYDGGLIYKTYTPQSQQSATMSAEQQRGWDLWRRRTIENVLAEQPLFSEAQIDLIAETIAEFRMELHDHVSAELGQLRAEVEILRSIVKDEVTPMRGRDVA